MPAILALLESLGYKSVAAVLDNNVPGTVRQLRMRFPEFFVTEIPAADIRTKPAVTAKPKKSGLLDDSGTAVRTELVDDFRAVVDDLGRYFADGRA